jgi:CubicO group peptidase (beta-lactamase class C family)
MRNPVFLFLCIGTSVFLRAQDYYYPEQNEVWKEKDAKYFDIKPERLQEAVDFALTNEYSGGRDLRVAIIKGFSREPYHEILGPTKKHGGPAGMILKKGFVIAKWGNTKRVDMTFSVTKSYLSTIAGLAFDKGLIKSTNDFLTDYVWDTTFDGEHNKKITWSHLLNQSSDWSGSIWGLHDWADRPPKEGSVDDWRYRTLHEPGTHFKYNDVRVNVLSYSLLNVWRKPLPQVLKTEIMDPIGASSTWRWFGYENSWTPIDGIRVQSVSGGGHSGGGLFINTEDHARFGLLFLSNGSWKGEQLISENWIEKATTASSANPNYGYLWWLNKKGARHWEGAAENIYYAAGFGGNFIIIIPDQDVVVVTRWLEPSKVADFIEKVLKAVE